MHFTQYDTRVAAYAVVVQDDQVLLTWWNGQDNPAAAAWTLPGGGVMHDEQVEDAVVREVYEETGYHVDLTGYLTSHSFMGRPGASGRDFRAVRLVFTARLTGGELGTTEIGGSTDRAEWIGLDRLDEAGPRVSLVDIALAAWRDRTSPNLSLAPARI